MPLPPEIQDWIDRSTVDHIGPFVNAWAAFNAWYRHVSGEKRDRNALDFVRTQSNPVRSAILPFLDPETADTPDAAEFKAAIAALHGALERFRLETLHDDVLEHVSFRSVPLKRGEQLPSQDVYRTITYKVAKSKQTGWTVTVANKSGAVIATIVQLDYDFDAFTLNPAYLALSPERRTRTRALYARCTPRPLSDLLKGTEPPITAGTIQFRCSCEDLFGGVIETLYRMRNMLLHGELKPNPAALACYEPAYYLLRAMLRAVR